MTSKSTQDDKHIILNVYSCHSEQSEESHPYCHSEQSEES